LAKSWQRAADPDRQKKKNTNKGGVLFLRSAPLFLQKRYYDKSEFVGALRRFFFCCSSIALYSVISFVP
jgi:hypothetical protein